MFKDFSVSDKTIIKTMVKTKAETKTETKTENKDMNTPKTNTKNKDLLDKINNEIGTINKSNNLLKK